MSKLEKNIYLIIILTQDTRRIIPTFSRSLVSTIQTVDNTRNARDCVKYEKQAGAESGREERGGGGKIDSKNEEKQI